MAERQGVKLIHCVIDNVIDDGVVRKTVYGIIDPTSIIGNIEIDDTYQREQLSDKKINKIMNALRRGTVVQAIDLGMRGHNCRIVDEADGSKTVYLFDPVYCVDGQQRLLAAARLLMQNPTGGVRLAATVIFDTDAEWELRRFTEVNVGQTGLSGNVLFRNTITEGNLAVRALKELCDNDPTFAMYERVSWGQYMPTNTLINGFSLGKVVTRLHRHAGPWGSGNPIDVARNLATIASDGNIGLKPFTENVKTFFDLLEMISPLAHIKKRDSALILRQPYMFALAMILSDHPVYWDETDTMLNVDTPTKKKLQSFDLRDPAYEAMLGTSSAGAFTLYAELKAHINSGRRTRRLVARPGIGPMGRIDDIEADEE